MSNGWWKEHRKRNIILLIITAALILMILSGIAYLLLNFQKPGVTVSSMNVVSVDETMKSFTLDVNLDVTNPNPFSLKIVHITGNIFIDNEQIGTIDNDTGERIPSGGVATIELTLTVDDVNLKILTGEKLRFEGKARARYLFYEGDSPFEKSIDIKPYDGDGHSIPPVAIVDGPHVARVLEDVTFDGSHSHDEDGTIISYQWDLGDGSTAEGSSVSHRYLHAGVYNVKLTVEDNDGHPSTAVHEIVVSL